MGNDKSRIAFLAGMVSALGCAEMPTPATQPEVVESPRQLSPAAALVSSGAPSMEFDMQGGNGHVRVWHLQGDAEIEIRASTGGFALASAPAKTVTYVVARRDSLFGYDSSGKLLVKLAGVVNTSALRGLSSDTLPFPAVGTLTTEPRQ